VATSLSVPVNASIAAMHASSSAACLAAPFSPFVARSSLGALRHRRALIGAEAALGVTHECLLSVGLLDGGELGTGGSLDRAQHVEADGRRRTMSASSWAKRATSKRMLLSGPSISISSCTPENRSSVIRRGAVISSISIVPSSPWISPADARRRSWRTDLHDEAVVGEHGRTRRRHRSRSSPSPDHRTRRRTARSRR
jgi:hypothetical protein